MPCSLDAATGKGFRTHFPYHTAYFERKQLKKKKLWRFNKPNVLVID